MEGKGHAGTSKFGDGAYVDGRLVEHGVKLAYADLLLTCRSHRKIAI